MKWEEPQILHSLKQYLTPFAKLSNSYGESIMKCPVVVTAMVGVVSERGAYSPLHCGIVWSLQGKGGAFDLISLAFILWCWGSSSESCYAHHRLCHCCCGQLLFKLLQWHYWRVPWFTFILWNSFSRAGCQWQSYPPPWSLCNFLSCFSSNKYTFL